jgi:hypothetical protein
LNFSQYADGFSYSKGKMEEAFRAGGFLDKAPSKPAKDPTVAALKREDIDLIVHIPNLCSNAIPSDSRHELNPGA